MSSQWNLAESGCRVGSIGRNNTLVASRDGRRPSGSFTIDRSVPEPVLAGGLNVVVNVVERESGHPLILRLTFNRAVFINEQANIVPLINAIIDQRRSPFFLRTEQFFWCDSKAGFPSTRPDPVGSDWDPLPAGLDASWDSVRVLLRQKWRSGQPLLLGSVVERGDYGDLFGVIPLMFTGKRRIEPDTFFSAAYTLMFDAVQGLAALHGAGVVGHFDIKIENFVVNSKRLDDAVFVVPRRGLDRRLQRSALSNIEGVGRALKDDETIALNFIDFDFLLLERDIKSRSLFNDVTVVARGSTDTMAPELAIAPQSRDVLGQVFTGKPDVYSLAVSLVELLAEMTGVAESLGLLGRTPNDPLPPMAGIVSGEQSIVRVRAPDVRAFLLVKMLHTGVPERGVLKKYRKMLEDGGSLFGSDATAALLDLFTRAERWRDRDHVEEFATEIVNLYRAFARTTGRDIDELSSTLQLLGLALDQESRRLVLALPERVHSIARNGVVEEFLAQDDAIDPEVKRWFRAATSWDFDERPSALDSYKTLAEIFDGIALDDDLDVLVRAKKSDTEWNVRSGDKLVAGELGNDDVSSAPRQPHRCSNVYCRREATLSFDHEQRSFTVCSHACARQFWRFIHPRK